MSGRLYAGTSGFAYPGWTPRFYPAGLASAERLPYYAARLEACEINNTFYRQPRPDQVQAWTTSVPPAFRFTVKAQRGGSVRALRSDPAPTLEWLLAPYRAFGLRLGTVLFRVPAPLRRDDEALDRLLAAWPSDLPVCFEFQDPSWEDDAVHDRLRAAGAALCVTDLGDPSDPAKSPPTVRLTGPFLYLRLRRDDYAPNELDAWAARIEPFLAAGHDAFVFFKHDPVGHGPELALELRRRLAEVTSRSGARPS